MKTTTQEIKSKINDLPDDYESHVNVLSPGKAQVLSFTTPEMLYDVEIHKGGDGLIASCSCPAHTLCKHIVAYYAVAKGIKPTPPIVKELENVRTHQKGYDLIAEAIEKLTDGIALVIEERLKK